jgi:predicted nucleic acid-binding protein
VTHLLDTSALLAFILNETGADRLRPIFEDERHGIAISVLTKVEFWSRLRSIGREAELEREWALHLPLFDAVLGVDEAVADASLSLRRATPRRLPTIDALIAATAATHKLILVHRDVHFRAIPVDLLRRVDLF